MNPKDFKKIYLDNNATTSIDKEVLDQIINLTLPLNPSSAHFYGKKAKELLEDARDKIASYLKVKAPNLVFTSGGTESSNLGIRSLLENSSKPQEKGHIIASDIDHSCVYQTLKHLEKKGFEISYIKVGKYGAIKPDQILPLIKENTKLIVTSFVNAETGIKVDLDKIAKIAEEKDIFLFVDAVALLGKEEFVISKGVTSMGFSSHKLHGPQGIGMCYFKEGTKMSPLFFGGPQEFEKRPGTQNLRGIVGFAKAVELLNKYLPKATENMQNLRDHFETTLKNELKDIHINGEGPRVCNTSNICFKGVDAESLLILLDREGVLASHGSACASGSMELSRVLLNMGIDPKDVRSSVRFSVCRNTTFEEIDKALKIIISVVNKLRS
ncbi:MAG: Cysteine desulfurase IscS [Candidatus Anoxychlamydiales bacterium]|nr:Cysteine desulfurase IscS [Candidatus Anoxychlamydiales bacterium]